MNKTLITEAALAITLLLALISISSGYAVTVLWGWFVSPFLGLPALPIPFAIGFCLLINLMSNPVNATHDDNHIQNLANLLLKPWIALGIGYIVTLFI